MKVLEPAPPWLTGYIDTPVARVPVVGTILDVTDLKNDRRARLGIGRDDYRIPPGLYAAGKPNNTSPVLVTANYKLTFDCLRSELAGINAWIVVIDTKGINVWCAAGKGTFGTNELTGRINALRLRRIVSHNVLVLPQLGAPGVAAHEVFKLCGFRVVYGPLRAEDIKEFLEKGMKATDEMRRVRFDLRERTMLVPIELLHNLKPMLAAYVLLLVLNLVLGGHRTFAGAAGTAVLNFIPFLLTFIIGCVVVPLLLPWIPFRAFAMKGLLLGLIPGALVLLFPGAFGYSGAGRLVQLSVLLVTAAAASFLSLNFTGSTTYTSLSGVRKEMKYALKPYVAAAVLGLALSAAEGIMRLVK